MLESDILLILFYLNIILHCLIRKRKSIEKVLIDSVNVPQVTPDVLGLKDLVHNMALFVLLT